MQWQDVPPDAHPLVARLLAKREAAIRLGVAVAVALGVQLLGLPAVCREHALRALLALFA